MNDQEFMAAAIKPVRPGLYERKPHAPYIGPQFAWWDGRAWKGWACTPEGAMQTRGFDSSMQNRPWRVSERCRGVDQRRLATQGRVGCENGLEARK